jgi:deoxyribose-phosphate aldolase
MLSGTFSRVCTVIGFPLGANSVKTKVFETKNAVENGADEIDMVINIGALKDKMDEFVKEEIISVVEAANGKCVKVIIETALLTDEEIVKVCKLAKEAKADYVKTSTGYAKGGATVAHVKLMKETVGENMKVKASGGIRSYNDAEKLIANGAERLGTSAGIKIISTGGIS